MISHSRHPRLEFNACFRRISMSEYTPRFVQNHDGFIVDTFNRFSAIPSCECDGHLFAAQSDPEHQVHLRKRVLRVRLVVLGERVESLTYPEAHSLAHVVYWTIQASRVDLTIGQTAKASGSDAESPSSHQGLGILEPFFDDVVGMLHDLYSDCDQALLDQVLDEIQAVVLHWNQARTAMARAFFGKLLGEPMSPQVMLVLPRRKQP
jgi:hypothetical protein